MKKRGRPKLSVSKKREAIVSAAAELFRTFGFEKISIDEICEKALCSKMTFYRQFHDKGELSLYLLERYNLEAKEKLVPVLKKEIPFTEKFKALTQLNEYFQEQAGLKFIEDLTRSNDPEILAGIKNITKKMQDLNFQVIKMGIDQGFFNRNFSFEFILFLIAKTNLLIKDPELSKIYPDFSVRAKAISDFFYYGTTAKRK